MQRLTVLVLLGVLAGCGPEDGNDNTGNNANTNELCGNFLAEGTEECDGPDLRGATCQNRGFAGGTLVCYYSCTYDESGCHMNACGNGTRDTGEACDDGNTRSGDGCSADCLLEAPMWLQVGTEHSPPARGEHAMAYDVARERLVLFGGTANQGQSQLADTWEYDGLDWVQAAPTSSPPGRFGHALAYDPRRERVVLFGGASTTGGNTELLGDTWEYDGLTWAEVAPASSPAPRAGHRLVWDAVAETVVFVGADFMGTGITDTYAWDGSTWTDTTAAQGPPRRGFPAVAYDAARDVLVLFGGSVSDGSTVTYLQDTWQRVGGAWEDLLTVAIPPGRSGALMVFHEWRGVIVLFGGSQGAGLEPLLDTWEHDGVVWQNTNPTMAPRAPGAGAFDAGWGRIVLFGGCIDTTAFTGCLGETWEMYYSAS